MEPAPEMLPEESMTMEGVLRKLVKPVLEAMLMPLTVPLAPAAKANKLEVFPVLVAAFSVMDNPVAVLPAAAPELLVKVTVLALPVVNELAVTALPVVVVPVYVCENCPVPELMVRLFPPETVTVPLLVNPDVAVMRPEMVGVAVQAVPVTVRLPPKEVRLLPETVKVLSRVVAPWRVRAPGVVEEPMVLTLLAPEPKVLVREAPVPMVEAPEEVKVVKLPAPPVMEPAPEMLPEESMTMEGVFTKFLYPVADSKLIPLVVFPATLPPVPAGKSTTSKVLVPDDGAVLLVGVMTNPITVLPAPELVLV
jgi:hypothetical protein